MVPFYSVNIVMEKGNIQYIEFDNLCANCGRARMVKSQEAIDRFMRPRGGLRHKSCMCGMQRKQLKRDDQDLRLFVTWEGTDVKGRRAETGSYRFSQFAGTTFRGMYEYTSEEY